MPAACCPDVVKKDPFGIMMYEWKKDQSCKKPHRNRTQTKQRRKIGVMTFYR